MRIKLDMKSRFDTSTSNSVASQIINSRDILARIIPRRIFHFGSKSRGTTTLGRFGPISPYNTPTTINLIIDCDTHLPKTHCPCSFWYGCRYWLDASPHCWYINRPGNQRKWQVLLRIGVVVFGIISNFNYL